MPQARPRSCAGMDSSSIDWPSITTALVAVYAAILSTYNLYVSRKERKRHVKVELSFAFPFYGPRLGENSLMLTVLNPRNQSVSLAGVGILLPNKRQVVFFPDLTNSDFQLPFELTGGNSCRVWTGVRGLAETVRNEGFSGQVKLVGFCRDQIGTTYKSKPYKFDTAVER